MVHSWGQLRRRPMIRVAHILVGLVAAFVVAAAQAQPDPSGIDFVTIGSPNNPAYHRDDPQGLITGRGSVPYEYRIGRFEVTTSQWLEFYTTFKAPWDMCSDSD